VLVEGGRRYRSGLLLGPSTGGLSIGTILRVHHSSQQIGIGATTRASPPWPARTTIM
jgi:hypothetical protein